MGNYHHYGPLLPSALSAALSHEIYQHTTLLAEATYSNADLLRVKTGLEYRLNRSVILLSGYHSKPHSLSFGTAFELGTLQIDLAFSWSAIPGITPAITLSYIPNNETAPAHNISVAQHATRHLPGNPYAGGAYRKNHRTTVTKLMPSVFMKCSPTCSVIP